MSVRCLSRTFLAFPDQRLAKSTEQLRTLQSILEEELELELKEYVPTSIQIITLELRSESFSRCSSPSFVSRWYLSSCARARLRGVRASGVSKANMERRLMKKPLNKGHARNMGEAFALFSKQRNRKKEASGEGEILFANVALLGILPSSQQLAYRLSSPADRPRVRPSECKPSVDGQASSLKAETEL